MNHEEDIFMSRNSFEYLKRRLKIIGRYRKLHIINCHLPYSEFSLEVNPRSDGVNADTIKSLESIVKKYGYELDFVEDMYGIYHLSRQDSELYSIEDMPYEYYGDEIKNLASKHNINLQTLESLTPYLTSICNYESTHNFTKRLATRAMNNYKTEALTTIEYLIFERNILTMLKEVYLLTCRYTEHDIDNHLTTDIPLIPYVESVSELKKAYVMKRKTEEYKATYRHGIEFSDHIINHTVEFLFVTNDSYFVVKHTNLLHNYLDKPGYITTRKHANGITINLFDTDVLLTEDGLTLLEMIHYDNSGFKCCIDFTVDIGRVTDEIKELDELNDDYSDALSQYLALLKGAWIPSARKIRSTFKPSFEGMKLIAFPPPLTNRTIETYKTWKDEFELNETPPLLMKFIARKQAKAIDLAQKKKRFWLGLKCTVASIGISLLLASYIIT